MAEKKETTFVLIPHALVVFKRPRSAVWQCRYKVDARWQRESTREYSLKKAKAAAHDLLIEANVRKKLKAAPITRTFKDIAKQAIFRMEKLIADGEGKSMYKEYISIIEKYHINFFGKYKVDAITHALVEEFEKWRVKRMGSTPSHSTTLNHNAALNRVFDESLPVIQIKSDWYINSYIGFRPQGRGIALTSQCSYESNSFMTPPAVDTSA